MKIAAQIRKTIKSFPESMPFGYADLGIKENDFFTAAKALERLQKQGIIKKLTKGVFYSPRKTIFGELGPDQNDLLNRYLFENGRRVAYETGFSLYNKLGLTTQMAFKIKVATKKNPIVINQGSLKVSSVKSYVDITEENYQLLGYLDVLKDIKRIPDCSVFQAIKRMGYLIKALNNNDQIALMKYAFYYPTRVRALLGAIFENLNLKINLVDLRNSLNPFTEIKLNIKEKDLPTINNWNIV